MPSVSVKSQISTLYYTVIELFRYLFVVCLLSVVILSYYWFILLFIMITDYSLLFIVRASHFYFTFTLPLF